MSAIFGTVRFDGRAVSVRDLERMGNSLAHRGPDGRKFVTDGAVGLGHCLMRVNHEDMFEAQPLRDREADLTLVADCRIDNREELAGAFGLSPAEIRDMPDSAFILRAYKAWGEDCAGHLVGDFAFALWDARAKKLVLARDHMGQRGVYYHHGKDFFAFATEIKGLWALADVPHALLDDEIGRYLLLMGDGRPPGTTLYDGILGLVGGTTLGISHLGKLRLHGYWEPGADPKHENQSEAYYIAKYREILSEAVACRVRRLMRAAAVMLSAGFDSAAIAGLAGPIVAEHNRKILGLSIVVPETYLGTKWDIRKWVEACKRVMPHLDSRYVVWRGESPLENIEKHFLAHDSPVPANHNTIHRLHAEAGAAGARVMMDGIGGDYTINPRGFGALAWLLRTGRIGRFIAELRPHRRLTRQTFWQMLNGEFVVQFLPARWVASVRRIKRGHLLAMNDSVINRDFLRALLKKGTVTADRTSLLVPQVNMRARIQAVAKRVANSSHAGGMILAAQYKMDFTRPFHDKRVVELGLAIPEDLHVKNGRNRYLACKALADIYPPELLTRDRANEAMTPNIAGLDGPLMPQFEAEAARMETNPRLLHYIDMRRARRILSLPTRSSERVLREQVRAIRAIAASRFIEWFERANKS